MNDLNVLSEELRRTIQCANGGCEQEWRWCGLCWCPGRRGIICANFFFHSKEYRLRFTYRVNLCSIRSTGSLSISKCKFPRGEVSLCEKIKISFRPIFLVTKLGKNTEYCGCDACTANTNSKINSKEYVSVASGA